MLVKGNGHSKGATAGLICLVSAKRSLRAVRRRKLPPVSIKENMNVRCVDTGT